LAELDDSVRFEALEAIADLIQEKPNRPRAESRRSCRQLYYN
jgi:hypothetical protein